jgi:hypothetical protein
MRFPRRRSGTVHESWSENSTGLSLNQLAWVFRHTATELAVPLMSRRTGVHGPVFFRPRDHRLPFEIAGGGDAAFVVGAWLDGYDGTGPRSLTVQMYVWDLGHVREVQFVAAHRAAGTPAAHQALAALECAVTQADAERGVHAVPGLVAPGSFDGTAEVGPSNEQAAHVPTAVPGLGKVPAAG